MELQGRYDQSSTLPRPDENKIYGKGFLYGSAGLGYEFTKTLGLEQNKFLNYGKLRASVAEVGSDTGPYRVLSPLTQNTYHRRRLPQRLLRLEPQPEARAHPHLRGRHQPAVLQNRLGLDFNYYYSRTRDQLIAPRVSQAAGFILQYINGGIVTNEGQEIALTGTPVKTASGFTWDVIANFYHNTNRVEELPARSRWCFSPMPLSPMYTRAALSPAAPSRAWAPPILTA